MTMRPVLFLFSFVACGAIEPTNDAGASDGGADAAGCMIVMCNGTMLCEVDAACPVGDGCNVCVCKVDSAGYHALCTGHACSCSNPADF